VDPPPPAPTVGDRLIIGYKLVKAVLQAGAAVALAVAVRAGFALTLAHVAIAFGDHSVHPLAVRLARWLSLVVTPTHLQVLALLLAADAVVSAVEGWVLRRGYAWGRWLVVVATGGLLPLELYEIVHRPRAGRVMVFVANLAIVVYLAWRIRSTRSTPTASNG
jgi:uncharacterized membrane protein (DUF2068 family)